MLGFDEQRLLAVAADRLRIARPLEDEFRPALRALLHGLEHEAMLSQPGAWRVRARLMNALTQRAALARLEQETPALREIDLRAPIFITGLPRWATSMLHNLLARLPGLWAPRLWELRSPVAPEFVNERWVDARIQATRTMIAALYDAAPELRRVHALEATEPDACSWLFRNNFSSLVHAFDHTMPSYVEFLTGTAMEPAYRDHARWLRSLALRQLEGARCPRLVLEDPCHLWHLEAILAVHPGATIVHLHRDPAEVLPALANSCRMLQEVDALRRRSKVEIGRYCAKMFAKGLESIERARRRFPATRFIDLSHSRLVEDPLSVVRELGETLRLDCGPVAMRGVERWLGARPRRDAGRWSLEEFGLDRDQIDELAAPYRRRFAAQLDPPLARAAV